MNRAKRTKSLKSYVPLKFRPSFSDLKFDKIITKSSKIFSIFVSTLAINMLNPNNEKNYR